MATKKTTTAKRRESTIETASQPEAGREPQAAMAPAEEHIRVRAYYVSLERNGHGADPLADWLRAEQELTGSGADA